MGKRDLLANWSDDYVYLRAGFLKTYYKTIAHEHSSKITRFLSLKMLKKTSGWRVSNPGSSKYGARH